MACRGKARGRYCGAGSPWELGDRPLSAMRRGMVDWLQSKEVPTPDPWSESRGVFIPNGRPGRPISTRPAQSWHRRRWLR